eukprot:sb/3467375/
MEGGRRVIAVEHRTVQTQYPHSPTCLAIEVTAPTTSYIVQRQDSVRPIACQTTLSYASSHCLAPADSVLVEPLLSARKVSRSHGSGYARLATQRRSILTQFPAHNTVYPAFEPSLPFLCYPRPNRSPRDVTTQTDGHTSHPRRLRPVLVEPVPNITPIGENVRTMRSSDAYGRLMEQIRTSNDPSFDRFMNSQIPPTNGTVSRYNKYSCYAPQGRLVDLPLTVKKNYPRKGGGGLGKGKRPGMTYKEVTPKPNPPIHSNQGLTPYQISVKIRKIGQVENIIGRLSTMKKIKKKGGKDEG